MRTLIATRKRNGKVLVLFTLLLPLLFGMLGLVNDLGLARSSQRQVQNGADSAAMAAAMELLIGGTESSATMEAQNILKEFSEISNAALSLNIPPSKGPFTGNSNYVEAVVTHKVPTWFVHIFNEQHEVTVRARAVAGIKSHPKPHTMLALNSYFAPGLALVGPPIEVHGKIAVNAYGSGFDEKGQFKLKKNPLFGVLTAVSQLRTDKIDVVGGVDVIHHIQNLDPEKGMPLRAFQQPVSDPYLYLPTPTTANGVQIQYPGVNGKFYSEPQDVVVAGLGTTTLSPGIYSSISIVGLGKVIFEPGIYVLLGTKSPALNIVSLGKIEGDGVMFYNAGSNFNPTSGMPDILDGNVKLDVEVGVSVGAITIVAPQMKITPLDDPTSPFDGMFIYQRRRNFMPITIDNSNLTGTIYARWSLITIVGPGTHQAQIVGGTISLTRPPLLGPLVFENVPDRWAKGRQVFLVE